MTRWQYWIFNVVAFLLGVLVLANFFINHKIERTNQELSGSQSVIERAQQAEPILDQLAKRIARGSDVDPQLKALLVKHKLNVTLEVDGKKKTYP